MLYNGVFGCHGNTCYVIFIDAILYMLYIIGPINVCTDFEINRYKIDENRVLFDVTNIYYMCHGDYDTSDRYFDKEHFETNQKSLRFKSVFGDLDLDLLPMFYCLSHALHMMYWNIHAKFN